MWYNPVLLLEYLTHYVWLWLWVFPLQDSLGGNAKTNLVANVHPSGRYIQHCLVSVMYLNHTLNHKIAHIVPLVMWSHSKSMIGWRSCDLIQGIWLVEDHVILFKEYDWLKIMRSHSKSMIGWRSCDLIQRIWLVEDHVISFKECDWLKIMWLYPLCPVLRCFGESLSTLNFAKRAKMIKNKVCVWQPTAQCCNQCLTLWATPPVYRLWWMKTWAETYNSCRLRSED